MSDILALLEDSKEQIDTVIALHDEALPDSKIRGRFTTRIKNVLEAQRSALDYLAVEITARYGTPKNVVYYPLASEGAAFAGEMENKMPGVATAMPDVADAIQRHQPYNVSGLRELNQLTREVKHHRLNLQIVRELYECRVTEKATGSYVAWRGVTFRPGAIESVEGSIELRPGPGVDWEGRDDARDAFDVAGGPAVFGVPIDYRTQMPYPASHIEAQRGPVHEWCFVRPHKPVIHALGEYQVAVGTAVSEIAQSAGL